MALLPPKTIRNPNSNKIKMIGANQKFLRSFMKSHKSFRNSIFPIFNFLLSQFVNYKYGIGVINLILLRIATPKIETVFDWR